jgi:hypothetical protein
MPWLDPGIHGVPWPPAVLSNRNGHVTRNRVDARVKPGHDEWGVASRRSFVMAFFP